MKIALAQLNYHIGNFEATLKKMKAAISWAIAQHADLIVFAELAASGYPPRDLLNDTDFLKHCNHVVSELHALSDKIAIIVGSPEINLNGKGKKLFNAAYFLSEKNNPLIVRKTLLPTYDIFDEYRYFEPATSNEIIHFKNKKIALSICEDIWNIGTEDTLYATNPLDQYIQEPPDFIINIAASPFHYNQSSKRLQVIQANCLRYHVPLLYVNHVGAQTELIFDGQSMVADAQGNIVGILPKFQEALGLFDTSSLQFTTHQLQADANHEAINKNNFSQEKTSLAATIHLSDEQLADIYAALVLGIQDFFTKLHFKKALIGLSGGIDSALVLALAQAALGSEHVWAVLMPSHFSSEHSITDALQLAEQLKVKHSIIPIESNYNSMMESLQLHFEQKPFDVAEENLQARLRGVLLMALSNKHGHIVLNTSNKSEAAVGYGTLYGDMCGALSVIGDLYKTQVYQLAQFINRERTIIPEQILNKAPSAELRPNQQDNQSLPEYEILDEILFQFIEKQQSPDAQVYAKWDRSLVNRIVSLVNLSEYKRYQTPPTLRISPKAFGMGRRMPIAAKYTQ